MVADPLTGMLSGRVITVIPGADGTLTAADEQKLRTAGINRFRFRFTDTSVNWTTGTVTLATTLGSWTDAAGNDGPAQTETFTVVGPTASLSNPFAGTGIDINLFNFRNWIDIVFPGAAGSTLDMSTIVDIGSEISFSGPGLGAITVDTSQAPVLVDATTRTVRYFLSGAFLPGAVEAAIAAGSYKYTGGTTGQAGTNSFSNLDTTNNRTYVDVPFRPTGGGTLSGIADAAAEFTIPGLTPVSGDEARLVGTEAGGAERWRFFFTGADVAAPGQITVTFVVGDVEPRTTYTNSAATETFTVLGPTANLLNPRNEALLGPRALNDRGYIDVAFIIPSGKTLDRASVVDLDPEFTLNAGLGFALDSSQAPLFLREDGTTTYFRYWTRGSHTSGAVTVTFLSGSFGFTDSTLSSATGSITPTDFTIGGVTTPNISYVDVQLGATVGDVLDAGSIDDSAAEFTLGGSGVGTAALIAALRPTKLEGTSTYRFYLGGAFQAGDVTVTYGAGAFTSNGIANLAETESFTIGTLTGELGDPAIGTIVGTDVLNGRGFFDVTYTVPTYAGGIDFASVTDLAPEFSVSSPTGFVLDGPRAPVYMGSPAAGQHKFRYFYSGPKTGSATLNFIGGGVLFTNTAGDKVPLFAPISIKVLADGSKKVVDVPFGTFANLDAATITGADISATGLTFTKVASQTPNTAGTVRFEITTGAAGVEVGAKITITYSGTWNYGSTAATITNTGSATLAAGTYIEVVFSPLGAPLIAELAHRHAGRDRTQRQRARDDRARHDAGARPAGRRPHRALLPDRRLRPAAGGATSGNVTVSFLPGTWEDVNGDAGTAGAESFAIIQRLQDESSNPNPSRVFFIDISGGMELRLADLDARAAARDPRQGVARDRPYRHARLGSCSTASGTIKVFKLGNLASAAAKFVLEVGNNFTDIQFWGVAAFQTNFDVPRAVRHLPAGLGAAAGQHDRADPQRDDLARGHPRRAPVRARRRRRAGAADRHVRQDAARRRLDQRAQDPADRPQPRRHHRRHRAARDHAGQRPALSSCRGCRAEST